MNLSELVQSSAAWAILGGMMILAELFVPGLVLVFLGLAALVTALALYCGWISGGPAVFSFYSIASLVLLVGLRSLFARLLPSEKTVSETDETKLALHQRVEVIEEIPAGGQGRVAFRGTTWPARFPEGSADVAGVGERVEIFGQDNLTWVVIKSKEQNS